jgi:peroxiredoxin
MKFIIKVSLVITFISLTLDGLFGQTSQASQTFQTVQTEKKDKKKLQFTGLLPGLKEGEKILILKFFYPLTEDSWKVIDTAVAHNGRFYFEHRMNDGPRLFKFHFSEHNCFIVTALDNEKVTLTSERDIDDYAPPKTATSVGEFLKFDGSKTADHFYYLSGAVFRIWYWSIGSINYKIKKFKDSSYSKTNLTTISGLLDAKSSVSSAARESMTWPFIRRLTPELFTECQGEMMRDSIWVSIYNALDEETKNSYNGKIMKEYIPLCMGQPALDFSFTAADNKQMSLNEVIKNNKLTILHFWSNGSLDRVRIHNELQQAYKKYKNKGLELISVSFDANPEKWKRAIQSDKIPGYQVCDFKEEESPLSKLYQMHPLSTVNILIDQNGKMLAYDVEGPALFGHLYRFFKE